MVDPGFHLGGGGTYFAEVGKQKKRSKKVIEIPSNSHLNKKFTSQPKFFDYFFKFSSEFFNIVGK